MSARIVIKSIKIQNFRSIKKEIIEAKNLKIFVGLKKYLELAIGDINSYKKYRNYLLLNRNIS